MQAINQSKNDIMLPIGGAPFWDQERAGDNDEGKNLKSIAESFVLLRSLKQSRDRWLYNTFPKFSTKTRGNKAPEIVHPPHTIQQRIRCDIEIGPHLFPETVLYEVNYLPSEVPPTSSIPISNTPSNPYWQSTVHYGQSYRYATPSSASQANTGSTSTANDIAQPSATIPPPPGTVPTPLITSLTPSDSVSAITPSLISQVNEAASTNPIFSNLLQLAAAKTATEDQLQTLGLLIQSLAAIDNANKAATAAVSNLQQPIPPSTLPNSGYCQAIPIQPVKPFDLVLEFRETPGERWIFPRGSVYLEKSPNSNSAGNYLDISITMCLSNDGRVCVTLDDKNFQDATPGNNGLYTATLRLKDASQYIWDILMRWIGGEEKNGIHKKQLEDLAQPKRLYLGLQLPPGPYLTQLQTACGPSYSMRPVRQGPMPQARAPRQRKPYTEKKVVATKETTGDSVPAKKPRGKSTATPIQCVSCQQTDVPLILGGRYCRPCVDAGKHNPLSVPQASIVPHLSQPVATANPPPPG